MLVSFYFLDEASGLRGLVQTFATIIGLWFAAKQIKLSIDQDRKSKKDLENQIKVSIVQHEEMKRILVRFFSEYAMPDMLDLARKLIQESKNQTEKETLLKQYDKLLSLRRENIDRLTSDLLNSPFYSADK